eukprot:CAMPEP_0205931884 /NCGR_PEP_ID=MMETSP1325-20131115/28348_1 /ASSEMBLY_ACC=CAM_ASM_000708 /TAXON_ID=236786 /ORGANISM="Florenciella sp., Strain RCC1007" /LENGTH=48 /DNA_ID= /DNA_START= /DNA_END= /DNA_ORIENTATION=
MHLNSNSEDSPRMQKLPTQSGREVHAPSQVSANRGPQTPTEDGQAGAW